MTQHAAQNYQQESLWFYHSISRNGKVSDCAVCCTLHNMCNSFLQNPESISPRKLYSIYCTDYETTVYRHTIYPELFSSSGYFQKASVFYKRVQCPEIFKQLFISSNRLIWFPCSDFSNVCNFAELFTRFG